MRRSRFRYLRVKSVRAFMKDKGLYVSPKYLEALDREIMVMLEKHSRMTVLDRRKTVRAIDIDMPKEIAKLYRTDARGL